MFPHGMSLPSIAGVFTAQIVKLDGILRSRLNIVDKSIIAEELRVAIWHNEILQFILDLVEMFLSKEEKERRGDAHDEFYNRVMGYVHLPGIRSSNIKKVSEEFCEFMFHECKYCRKTGWMLRICRTTECTPDAACEEEGVKGHGDGQYEIQRETM
jgi:hypothetical protein